MMKKSTVQRVYVVRIASAAYIVSLPGTVNTAETPSTKGVKNKIKPKIMVILSVTVFAFFRWSKLLPRAARGTRGSLEQKIQQKH